MSKAHGSKPTCFVVMPFGGVWDGYYEQVYRPAIEDTGLEAERADDVFQAGSVLQTIVDSLSRAAVVLVDVSENNRNVHYELGLAHALGRPTVLVAPQGMPLFFDVGQERMVTYDKNDAFWGADLKQTVTKALSETVKQPATAVPTVFLHIKPARIESEEVVVRLRRIEEQLADLSRLISTRRLDVQSGYAEKLHSPLVAQDEAAKLLRSVSSDEAVRQLMNEGYGRAMAEDAVFIAARRIPSQGKS
ncbi:MAG TPA: hypothetical protein VFB63_09760 [Bryobacteraceae bacterium]|nr:hypothetical protein [Bryobacteraceae bacterium]